MDILHVLLRKMIFTLSFFFLLIKADLFLSFSEIFVRIFSPKDNKMRALIKKKSVQKSLPFFQLFFHFVMNNQL